MKRTQQILLVVIMMFVAVSGVYRYLPCFKEVFISGREPYENCAEAGSEPKGAIGEASSNLSSCQVRKPSGAQVQERLPCQTK